MTRPRPLLIALLTAAASLAAVVVVHAEGDAGMRVETSIVQTEPCLASVRLLWDANPATDNVAGYRMSWGTAARTYTINADAGNVTLYTAEGLPCGVRRYFAVRAWRTVTQPTSETDPTPITVEQVSGYSNEVSVLTASAPPPVPTTAPNQPTNTTARPVP